MEALRDVIKIHINYYNLSVHKIPLELKLSYRVAGREGP
jgi:hypothetical protein